MFETAFLLQLGGIIGTVVTVASAIVAMTPTPADDKFLGKLYKIVEALALVIGKAKEKNSKKDLEKT